MKVRIHYTILGVEDSVDITGDGVEDCRQQWETFSENKPCHSMWSEILEDSQ